MTGARPAAWYSSQTSVSMKFSGWTGQPGTLTIGRPPAEGESPPGESARPMQPGGVAPPGGEAKAAGRVARHGVEAAVGGAGADRDHAPRLRRELVEPPVERQRLAGRL